MGSRVLVVLWLCLLPQTGRAELTLDDQELAPVLTALAHNLPDLALQRYRDIVPEDERLPELTDLELELLVRSGSHEQALALGEAAQSTPRGRFWLGRAALGAGEFSRAIKDFEEVIQTLPAEASVVARARLNQAKAFWLLEEPQNSLGALEGLLESLEFGREAR